MTPQEYQNRIEFHIQEAERYGKLAEYYKGQIEGVKRMAAVMVGFLIIVLIALAILLPKPKHGNWVPGGEQFPIQNPAT